MNWWKRLRANPLALGGAIVLIALYLLVMCADAIAPYGPNDALKDSALLPPTPIYWRNARDEFIGPHVYPTIQGAVNLETGDRATVVDRSRPYLIRPFVRGRLFGTVPAAPVPEATSAATPLLAGVPGRLNLLGTDDRGRDQLSRLLYGGRISLSVGLIGTAISFTIGCTMGGISGYFGGWVDAAIMRLAEVLMSVPTLYLLVALAAILPTQISNAERFALIVALVSFVQWAGLARVIRGQVLSIKEETFAIAAKATGASPLRIVWRHILPQTTSYIAISATLSVPSFIGAESVLSLIGLGIQQPDPSWGNMLSLATNAATIVLQPWLIWSPAVLLIVTVLAFNLLGDGLRDALDPKNTRSRLQAPGKSNPPQGLALPAPGAE